MITKDQEQTLNRVMKNIARHAGKRSAGAKELPSPFATEMLKALWLLQTYDWSSELFNDMGVIRSESHRERAVLRKNFVGIIRYFLRQMLQEGELTVDNDFVPKEQLPSNLLKRPNPDAWIIIDPTNYINPGCPIYKECFGIDVNTVVMKVCEDRFIKYLADYEPVIYTLYENEDDPSDNRRYINLVNAVAAFLHVVTHEQRHESGLG